MEGDLQKFLNALEIIEKHDILIEILEAFDTLSVYAFNQFGRPEETKFHFISAINIHFKERLGHIEGAEHAMLALGYIKSNNVYEYNKAFLQPEALEQRKGIISQMIEQLEAHRSTYHTLFINSDCVTLSTHNYTSVMAVGYHSDRGRRATMEDCESVIDSFCEKEDMGFFAVYDGHGGRDSVDFISRTLHINQLSELRSKNIVDMIHTEEAVTDTITQAVGNALTAAYCRTDAQLRRASIIRSGSTAVTCLIYKTGNTMCLSVANVGDSRAVINVGTESVRLTVDHKATLPEEIARVQKAGGFITQNHRVNGVLAITRALGDHLLKENEIVTWRPHLQHVNFTSQNKEKILILACDGLWDVLTDEDAMKIVMEILIRDTTTAVVNRGLDLEAFYIKHYGMRELEMWEKLKVTELVSKDFLNRLCVQASKKLVDEALRRNTNDNVTVMVILL